MSLRVQLRKSWMSTRRRLIDPWRPLSKCVRTVRNFECLQHAMGWRLTPEIDPSIDVYESVVDVNHRRLLDAMVVGGACRNIGNGTFLEIGTAHGEMTAVMAENAPEATIHTVNIPPEEIGEGGKWTTFALATDDIGRIYREKNLTNVNQVFANTANWTPEFDTLDLAFIDGSHDAEFVYHDTRLVLQHARPGTVIIWHDFCPPLAHVYSHLTEVCTAMNWLYKKRYLRGPLLSLEDSYTGLYVVDGRERGLRPEHRRTSTKSSRKK